MNCPSCNRLLYSRRHKTCGFCGAELPAEALFSQEEIAAIDAEKEELAKRRTKAKQKEEEEKEKQAAASAGLFMIPPPM